MAELPRILFGHERKHETGPHRMAEARPEEMVSSQILRSRPGVCCKRRFWISEQVFIIESSGQSCAFISPLRFSCQRNGIIM